VGINPQDTHGESADKQLRKFKKIEVYEIFFISFIVYQDKSYIYPEIKTLKKTYILCKIYIDLIYNFLLRFT